MTIVSTTKPNQAYHKFVGFLTKKFPINRPNNIEIRLEDYKYIPYKVNGELTRAYATINAVRNSDKLVIRLAVGKNGHTIKEKLNSIAHEYCHCMQHYRGEVFNTDWDARLELEAIEFANSVVSSYYKMI